eukprot:GFYU01001579.1.p2 GENE.GFYU01001579.1~~GFYU01001579.1.p2  ORF type:complete len:165 (-),score=33.27 GFYU01001579.1:354-848(-)
MTMSSAVKIARRITVSNPETDAAQVKVMTAAPTLDELSLSKLAGNGGGLSSIPRSAIARPLATKRKPLATRSAPKVLTLPSEDEINMDPDFENWDDDVTALPPPPPQPERRKYNWGGLSAASRKISKTLSMSAIPESLSVALGSSAKSSPKPPTPGRPPSGRAR